MIELKLNFLISCNNNFPDKTELALWELRNKKYINVSSIKVDKCEIPTALDLVKIADDKIVTVMGSRNTKVQFWLIDNYTFKNYLQILNFLLGYLCTIKTLCLLVIQEVTLIL